MRQMRTAAMVLGAIFAVPLVGFAGVGAPGAPAQTKVAAAKPAATHSFEGVVKSIDPTTLIVEKGTGKGKKDMTFALDSTTVKSGDITVGSTVAVRYRTEASKLMAVSVQPHKPAAHKAA